MQLLKIEDHASEFNIGDHVIVSTERALNSKSLLAVGFISLQDTAYVIIKDEFNSCSSERCPKMWPYALKISSELNAQLDDLLKIAEKTTDESRAPKSKYKNSSRRVLVVSKLYSSCLAAHNAMDACKKLPGHIVSHEHGIDQQECFVSSVFDFDIKADPESIKKPFLQFGACSFGWIAYDEGPRSDDAKAYIASEIRDAKRRCGDLCVSIDSSLPRLRPDHQQQAIAITEDYSKCDDALSAAVKCSVIPGHLISYRIREDNRYKVISLYRESESVAWGSLPKGCSHIYVTRNLADKDL